MGTDIASWCAAIGRFAINHHHRGSKDDQEPERSDVRKALNQHLRFKLLAAVLLPGDAAKRKEAFNGLVCELLLASGLESNPGPPSFASTSTSSSHSQFAQPPKKKLRTLDTFFSMSRSRPVDGTSITEASPSASAPVPVASASAPTCSSSSSMTSKSSCSCNGDGDAMEVDLFSASSASPLSTGRSLSVDLSLPSPTDFDIATACNGYNGTSPASDLSTNPETSFSSLESSDNHNSHTPASCFTYQTAATANAFVLSESQTHSLPKDVGEFIGQNIPDSQKVELLENPWKPPKNYNFPYSISMKNGKEYKRYVNHSHLEKFSSWLVFSPSAKGLFCKYCAWFTVGGVAGMSKSTALKKFVTVPLTNFKDLLGKTGDLETHQKCTYHKAAVDAGKRFLETFTKPSIDVANQINQHRLALVQGNRQRLVPIIRAVLFLGRQGLAFRGHRDDGQLFSPCRYVSEIRNEGNFRELLRLMVESGDVLLKEHLQNTSSRATYISKTTQNQLIKCVGDILLEKILDKVRNVAFYAVMFDETTDAAHKSQLSIILRYVTNDGEVSEDFIGFIDAFEDLDKAKEEGTYDSDEDDWEETRRSAKHDDSETEIKLTGKAIGQIVLRALKKMGLSLDHCVGIGTDGCSVMMSEVRGAVSEIQKEARNALRTPCYNHKLNLSLSKSSKIPSIRNAVGTMKSCVSFFDASPKRNQVLQKKLGHQLSGLCETRWVERHDGVLQFSVDLPKILEALDVISEWSDASTSSKASQMHAAMTDSSFLISVMCLSDILALSHPLSKLFQKTSLNLDTAAQEVSNLLSVLAKRRAEPENYFQNIWKRATELADVVGTEIKPRRKCKNQGYRANHDTDSHEAHFRVSVFVPLLDQVLEDLRDRFPQSVLDVFHLPMLLPQNIVGKSHSDLEQITQLLLKSFSSVLPYDQVAAHYVLKGELEMWLEKWSKENFLNLPESSGAVLQRCDKDVYPMIHQLLHILTTLPVSNATAERSFSALRRLKSWLRATMSEERLTGLALMHVHTDISVSIDEIVDKYAKSGKRRLEFVL